MTTHDEITDADVWEAGEIKYETECGPRHSSADCCHTTTAEQLRSLLRCCSGRACSEPCRPDVDGKKPVRPVHGERKRCTQAADSKCNIAIRSQAGDLFLTREAGGRFLRNLARTTPLLPCGLVTLPQMVRK